MRTYTDAIRKFTTEARFMTELVDHLPASDTVPSPLKFHGYIAGAEGKLTHAADVHRHMRALEAVSPRVKVVSMGTSEEGREMILVAIASEEAIANLDRYRDITRQLSDPRRIGEADARKVASPGHARPPRVGAVPLRFHRYGTVQPRARSDHDQRVASHGSA